MRTFATPSKELSAVLEELAGHFEEFFCLVHLGLVVGIAGKIGESGVVVVEEV